MFYVGQKVVCVKANTSLLKVGKIYTVRGIWECCLTNLDVGLSHKVGTHCDKCQCVVYDKIQWINSVQFVPLEEWQEYEFSLNELIKEINEPLLVEN